MIYQTSNTGIEFEGAFYGVGMKVLGNSLSEYEGLNGWIIEIRTDPDKETENEGPDIHCTFEPPETEDGIKALEAVFSDLYGVPKTMDDIALDEVIMAADMLQIISEAGDEP